MHKAFPTIAPGSELNRYTDIARFGCTLETGHYLLPTFQPKHIERLCLLAPALA